VAVTDRAPGTARLLLDGAPVDSASIERLPVSPAGTWTVRERPAQPLTDGLHRVDWAVRAAGGNWSKARRDSFVVELPLARTVLEVAPAAGGLATGQIAGLTLRALDRHDRALANTVRASFVARVGATVVDSLGVGDNVPGEARAYARITGGSVADFSATLLTPRVRPELAEATAHITLAAPGAAAHAVSGFARTADGHPIAGARVAAGAGDSVFAVTNADGFFALADSTVPLASAPGYVTLAPTGAQPKPGPVAQLWLTPIAGGALIGRRIALDPTGGGADTTGMFALPGGPGPEPNAGSVNAPGDSTSFDTTLTAAPAGVAQGDTLAARRALVIEADANLRVARALREYLEAAGARVVLTRERPDSLTAVDRLRVTEGFGAERVVSIAHRAAARTASAGHYFSSPNGTALAKRIAARLDGRGVSRKARVLVSPAYLIQQTGAIAVEVNLPDARVSYVEPTRGAARLREEAYALYIALLEDLGGTPAAFQVLPVTVTRAGAPAAGVPVALDGRWTLITGADGRVKFDGLPAGAILGVIADSSGTARAKLPAPASGVVIALPADTTGR
jgi:N-acetylmuramoyl-L-alanine amidase